MSNLQKEYIELVNCYWLFQTLEVLKCILEISKKQNRKPEKLAKKLLYKKYVDKEILKMQLQDIGSDIAIETLKHINQ